MHHSTAHNTTHSKTVTTISVRTTILRPTSSCQSLSFPCLAGVLSRRCLLLSMSSLVDAFSCHVLSCPDLPCLSRLDLRSALLSCSYSLLNVGSCWFSLYFVSKRQDKAMAKTKPTQHITTTMFAFVWTASSFNWKCPRRRELVLLFAWLCLRECGWRWECTGCIV